MKNLIITGIRRIGYEVAKELLKEGYRLAVVYKTSEERAKSLSEFGEVLPIRADLSSPEAWDYIVEESVNRFGSLHGFIHLASPYARKGVLETKREDFYEHFVPIAEAFFFISQKLYPIFMKNEGSIKGRIIAFGDWAIDCPYKNFSAYFVAKGALHTAVKVLAKEFAPHVIVNCIAPGPVLKAEDYTDEEWEKILKRTPLRREVPIRDVVNAVKYLLSVEGITGEIIRLDGGRHLAGTGV
ncbi:SDR family NAD(P)-dependent oxidoreductase [Aquifex sp.]